MVDRWSNPQKGGVTIVQTEVEGEMKEKGGGRSQAEKVKGRSSLVTLFFFFKLFCSEISQVSILETCLTTL